jgi:hypothetical protein
MIGPLLRVYSGGGPRARLSILIFHRVLDEKDPLFPETPDVAEFRATMGWVRQWFNVLPLEEAVDRLRRLAAAGRARHHLRRRLRRQRDKCCPCAGRSAS